MDPSRPSWSELNDALMGVFPPLDETRRRIALTTYRLLALGAPASPEAIGSESGLRSGRVREVLDDWIGVYRDGNGDVVGFWGLAIPERKHRFTVDGIQLHTWCAWDTLFLPELIGSTATVESACETSGETVRLTVSPAGVESVEPASPFVSFLVPTAEGFEAGIVKNFCHYVHFFRSRADGDAWTAKNPGTFLLTLEEADRLARWKNAAQFGESLRARKVAS